MLPVKTFEERVISNIQESDEHILNRLYTLNPKAISTLTVYTTLACIPTETTKGLYVLLLSILEDQQQKFLESLEPKVN